MKLWNTSGGVSRLLATKCAKCGNRTFPPAVRCVRCGSSNIEEIELSGAGVVETTAGCDDVYVAEVRLEDGTLVFGHMADGKPKIGSKVTFSPSSVVRFVRA